MGERHNFINIFIIILITLLVVLGLILGGISYLPFEILKIRIDAIFLNGNKGSFYYNTSFQEMTLKLRFIGIALFVISWVIYAAQHYGSAILSSGRSLLLELKHHINGFLREEDKIHLYSFFIVILLAITFRVSFLSQPMRYDEAATFTHYASQPLYVGLSDYSFPNNHLFHTFLVHIAYLFLGNRPWITRLPVFIAGILIVPASYIAIRLFYNKHAALLTAGFIASSSLLIEYSTNARGYTLVCLFFMLILSLSKILKENENSFAWLLFAVFSALGFHTIPIMLYPFGIVIMWFLASIISKDTNLNRGILLKDLLKFSFLTVLFVYMLYLPVLLITGWKSIVGNDFVLPLPWSDFIKQIPVSLYSVWSQWNRDIPVVLSLLLMGGFIVSVVFHKKIAADRVPLILPAVFWLATILALQRVVPYNRIWLFLLPLYIGLASSGIIYAGEAIYLRIADFRNVNDKKLHHICAVMTIALSLMLGINVIKNKSIYNSEETGIFKDAEQVAVFLKDYLREGDRVISTSEAPLEYYFNLHGLPVDEYLYFSDLSSARRILTVINESNHKSLQQFMNEAGLSVPGLDAPRIIKQFPSATVYEIRKTS